MIYYSVAMVQLWMLMGVAMFGGLAVVLVAVVINGILGRLQQRLQRQILGYKSKRIKILNEVINGIKVKIYSSLVNEDKSKKRPKGS